MRHGIISTNFYLFKPVLLITEKSRKGPKRTEQGRKEPKRAEKGRKRPKRAEKDQKELDKKSRKGPKRTGYIDPKKTIIETKKMDNIYTRAHMK